MGHVSKRKLYRPEIQHGRLAVPKNAFIKNIRGYAVMPKLAIVPASSKEAQLHLHTIIEGVELGHIQEFLDQAARDIALGASQEGRIAVWGLLPGRQNLAGWKLLQIGDKTIIYSRGNFNFLATVVQKIRNRELAQKVWGTTREGKTWELIFFLTSLKKISIPLDLLRKTLGYTTSFVPQRFIIVRGERINTLAQKHGDIERALIQISEEGIQELKPKPSIKPQLVQQKVIEIPPRAIDPALPVLFQDLVEVSRGDVDPKKYVPDRDPSNIFEDLVYHAFRSIGFEETEQLGYRRGGEGQPDGIARSNTADYQIIYDAKQRREPYKMTIQEERALRDYIEQYRKRGVRRMYCIVISSDFGEYPKMLLGIPVIYIPAEVLVRLISLKIQNPNVEYVAILKDLFDNTRGKIDTEDVEAWVKANNLKESDFSGVLRFTREEVLRNFS